MFRFDVEQFTNTCSGGGHEPHDEIPLLITISFKPGFEKFVIGIANYIFQKVLLLHLYELHFQFILLSELQELIDTLQSQVYCLRFEVLYQIPLVCQKVLLVYFSIMVKEILHCPHIRGDGVLGKISLCQIIFEFCYHITLIYNKYSNNIAERIGYYPQLPNGWAVVPMQMLCSLTDGEKLEDKEMPNLDVKYLRGERDFKTWTNGRYVAANSLLILVDGENSGEVFRTPIEGYQGSTFKQLHLNKNMCADYLLYVINLHRKALRENKIGSAIPHLNKKLFKAIEVPVPPYNEQVRIVAAINSALNRLDAIMENL